MFKNYSGLWLLLATALAVIFVVAFSDDIVIGNYTVKKAPFDKTLLASESEDLPVDSLIVQRDTVAQVKVETDSLPQSLFIFGDSMTWNLALRLAQYAKANGHTIHAVNWDSSNTKIWADYDTLANQIARYKPTQIFISLGSNELYFKDPRARLPYIRKILEVIDTIPYVWIGPPNWQKDSGINDLLEATCKPGSFFRSEGMPKSAHPFVANVPSDSIGKINPNIVFLKALNK